MAYNHNNTGIFSANNIMSRIFSQFQADYTIVRIGIITMFLVTIAFSIIILPNPRSWTTIWFWKLQAHQCSRILYNNLCIFGGADMFCLHSTAWF